MSIFFVVEQQQKINCIWKKIFVLFVMCVDSGDVINKGVKDLRFEPSLLHLCLKSMPSASGLRWTEV